MATTAKVFMSGRSQAVRLPKEFRFDVDEVLIERTADGILLRATSKAKSLQAFFERLEPFPESFMADRHLGVDDSLREPFSVAVPDLPKRQTRRKRVA